MDYEIKIFSSIDDELKKDWLSLEIESHNYCFQCYDWFENWVNSYRTDNSKISFSIAVVKHNSKVIAIFPFEVENKFGSKILKWAGDKQMDYCSPILSKNFNFDKEKFIDLFNRVIDAIKNIDIIYLVKQPEYIYNLKNPFVQFLKNYIDSKTYYITLPKKWDEYTKKILKKDFHVQNLRKKKQLKKLGNLKFKIIKDKNEKNRILDEFIIQKNIRLSSKGTTEVLESRDLNFYKKFEEKISKNYKSHLSCLILNNNLISIHWGIIYKKRFYYLLLSMKEGEFRRYSPGRLLISLLIRWTITKKLEIFDFTLGDEDYKKSWSNNNSYIYNYIKRVTLNGYYLFLLIKFKLFLKSIDKKNYLRKIWLKVKTIYK